jgi:co-chaperonin GroES (HSP10)
MKVQGKIKPLKDKVFVSNMEFGMERTTSGLYIPSADGKTQGIMPRWGRVWAVGDEQKEVAVGDWVCIEHGRWTRTVEVEQEDGSVIEVRMVDNDAILMSSDEKPNDVYRSVA